MVANCVSKIDADWLIVLTCWAWARMSMPSPGLAKMLAGILGLPMMLLKLASITERFTVLENPLGDCTPVCKGLPPPLMLRLA